MLIWINGPFGGGKTQTAHELARRLPGAVVCDPELVGFGLHSMTPPALRADFQDLRSWRAGVVEVLDLALRGQPGTVVVPMTLTVPAYFEEVVGTLRDSGHLVHHVALLAEREIVLDRLRARGLGFGLRFESWAVQALDGCLDSLAQPQFAEHLVTDDLSVPQVADRIADLAGVALRDDTDGPVRGRVAGVGRARAPAPARLTHDPGETARTARARAVPTAGRSARVVGRSTIAEAASPSTVRAEPRR